MILLCDASSDGTGAVLSHELPDGKPIAFASRIFTAFEKELHGSSTSSLLMMIYIIL